MTAERDSGGQTAPAMRLTADETERALPPSGREDRPAAKVGVAELVVRSWMMLLRHLDVFVMLMWRPFAVSVAAAYGAIELSGPAGPRPAAMLFTAVSLIAVIPVITAWHRMILLGADNPDAHVSYRLGRAEWSYLKAAVLLYGLGYVVGLAVNALYGPLLGGGALWLVAQGVDPGGLITAWGALAVKWLSIALILGFLVARFFLVLPARAVGRDLSYGESAIVTRGNGVRLVAAYVLASLPAAALTSIFSLPEDILASARGVDQQFLDLVLSILPRILLYTIAVGILSLAYERLVGVPRRMMR